MKREYCHCWHVQESERWKSEQNHASTVSWKSSESLLKSQAFVCRGNRIQTTQSSVSVLDSAQNKNSRNSRAFKFNILFLLMIGGCWLELTFP